ncbi:hypothetical protein FBZ33_4030 [Micromonospora sp. A202]|nr:hypothetical protein FBZ33_4030 [Micromonospora sp. A202]
MVNQRGAVPVTDHMFHLVDTGTVLGPPLTYDNGLSSTHPGGVVVFTGISSGFVQVTVDARDAPPATTDLVGWDDVVETSVHAPAGRMVVSGVMNDAPELPVLTRSGPGSYRIRIHARGRDIAVDLGALEPVEDYLVVAWPAQPATETSLKHTDTFGAGLRSAPRRPRPVPRTEERKAARHARLQAMDEKFRTQETSD